MDTLLQDLRSALQTLGEHPAFTLAAAMSLGFGLETGAVPATPAPRHSRSARRRRAEAVRLVDGLHRLSPRLGRRAALDRQRRGNRRQSPHVWSRRMMVTPT